MSAGAPTPPLLFEASLTLRFSELRGIGRAVRGLGSYGAVLALLMLATATHWSPGCAGR